MKKCILFSAVLAVLAGCSKGPKVELQPWESYRNPVVQDGLEDPAVMYSDGKFYLYYNGTVEDDVVPLMESEDLVGWEALTSAFTALTAPSPLPNCTIGSCSVIPHQDGFLMYYTASAGTSVVGVAEAPYPTGPWSDVGTVVTTVTSDAVLTGAPSVFSDGGSLYMAVGTSKGIFLLALSADGKSLAGETPVRLASEAFFAPAMYRHGGKWYLLATSGSVSGGANSTARIVYGRADNSTGPFVNSKGETMLDGASETLLEGSRKFAGPGSCPPPLDLADGSSWLVYNAFDLTDVTRGRTLMLDPLFWEDGWMKIRGGTPSFCSDCPVFKSE
jgi:arabinan endo-1,5-alpha-L-arabinosidase